MRKSSWLLPGKYSVKCYGRIEGKCEDCAHRLFELMSLQCDFVNAFTHRNPHKYWEWVSEFIKKLRAPAQTNKAKQ